MTQIFHLYKANRALRDRCMRNSFECVLAVLVGAGFGVALAVALGVAWPGGPTPPPAEVFAVPALTWLWPMISGTVVMHTCRRRMWRGRA